MASRCHGSGAVRGLSDRAASLRRRACPGGRPSQDARRVSASRAAATFPRGPPSMMTAETDKAIQNGLAWLARTQNSDGSFGGRDVSRQHRGDEPVRAGVHGVGVEPGPRAVWGPDRQGAGLRDGEHVAVGLHRGGGVVDARTDVFARVRDVVSGGSVRDDASAGDPREAAEGGAADHRHAEHRRGLAVSAGAARCGPVGDDLPDQRAAGGAERGAVCAEGDGRRRASGM